MKLRLILLVLLVFSALLLNLCLGDVPYSPQVAIDCLFHPESAASAGCQQVIWQLRLPRILIASVVGICLSVSGYILQSLSRNNLADPYLTGVSSGAGLAAAFAMICGLDFQFVPIPAFAGGLASAIIVALLAKSPYGLSVTRLLLGGVALSAICGGIITLLLTNSSSPLQSQGISFWLGGGICGRTWSELPVASCYTAAGLVLALLMTKQMRLLSLGVSAAQALGVNVARCQWILLSTAVLLCGAAVSISGLVGFVGLVAPHIARNSFGRDERVQLATSALLGMVLVLLSDLAARTLGNGQEFPLGTLLALVGGPFFLWQISRHQGEGM